MHIREPCDDPPLDVDRQKQPLWTGTVIGGDPQDRKYAGEPTFLQIGDDNVFREYVTIHRATGEGRFTTIGNDVFVMAYTHIGHNCHIHDQVTITNSAGIAGHVTIEERRTLVAW